MTNCCGLCLDLLLEFYFLCWWKNMLNEKDKDAIVEKLIRLCSENNEDLFGLIDETEKLVAEQKNNRIAELSEKLRLLSYNQKRGEN